MDARIRSALGTLPPGAAHGRRDANKKIRAQCLLCYNASLMSWSIWLSIRPRVLGSLSVKTQKSTAETAEHKLPLGERLLQNDLFGG